MNLPIYMYLYEQRIFANGHCIVRNGYSLIGTISQINSDKSNFIYLIVIRFSAK